MKRKSEEPQPGTVEILRPGEIELRRPRTNLEALDALVQQRVAEILAARDEFIFEPFFRSRQVAYELRRLQTVPERKKWSVYFERYGCLYCQRQDQPHGTNGFCGACHCRVTQRLKEIVSELMQERKGDDENARRYLRSSFNG
jgi:hypothetical protein